MLTRNLREIVAESLEDTPVTLIVGPRQSGKSTLVNQFVGPERRYVTLDDPNVLGLAKENPKEFLETYGTPLVIDEVQRAPDLLLPIKLRVDRQRTPGSYLLTGSANILALPKIGDSLAGRMAVVDLLPLTQAELDGTHGNFIDQIYTKSINSRSAWESSQDLLERLGRGGFPEHALRAAGRRRSQWCESYVRTLLERDVRDLSNIEGLTQLPRLLTLLAVRNGSSLNVSSLARDTGIAATTLTRYLDLLKALFLLQTVPPWTVEEGARLLKAPKLYLVDSGLACYLAHAEATTLRSQPMLLKPMLEGFVANELQRLITQSDSRPWLLHLKTVRQKEVDFVLEGRDRRVVGIEVLSSRNPTQNDAEGLRYLRELAGDRFQAGIMLYDGLETIPFGDGIVALPYSALWESDRLR